MKKIITMGISVCLLFLSCQTEQFDADNNAVNSADNISKAKVAEHEIITSQCMVIDADRCPFGDQQPTSNFWWSKTPNDFFNSETYFSSTDEHNLVFTKYDNGTARITGTTINELGCIVTVDVRLIEKKTWEEWSAEDGGHKKEGCAGNESNSGDMVFYVIDSEHSSIVASNCGDCTGTYGVEQRPDPLTDGAKFGAHFGPGGANYDSNIGAIGLSTWGYLTDPVTGERLWKIDFNFLVDCPTTCETAYAKGTGDGTVCFIDDAILDEDTRANRWGWRIGPLSEGTYTYNVYAAAGQCDIDKGYLVGTVEINYSGGTVTAVYDLIDGYTITEEHLYAGSAPYPTNKKGSYTLAPGQMKVGKNLSGPIYVIAHSVICGEFPSSELPN